MSDRKLLEMAAKGAGIQIIGLVNDMIAQPDHRKNGFIIRNDRGGDSCWNPLTDDGDALRLVVKLKLSVMVDFDRVDVTQSIAEPEAEAIEYLYELPMPTDPYAVTRRAIVRAAAEIGKNL